MGRSRGVCVRVGVGQRMIDDASFVHGPLSRGLAATKKPGGEDRMMLGRDCQWGRPTIEDTGRDFWAAKLS